MVSFHHTESYFLLIHGDVAKERGSERPKSESTEHKIYINFTAIL